MLPATKAIPKEMLPVVDKPLIQYVVNEAIVAGIKEIVLVTHASKNSIENHFDTSFELEAQLESRVKRHLLEEIRTIVPPGIAVISVRQAEAKGLGHAISCARSVVGDNPFAVLLPDVLIDEYQANPKKDNMSAMVRRYRSTGHSQIMVEAVQWDDVSKYGIVDFTGYDLKEGSYAEIKDMVEKPETDAAPSNMAVVGRYILSADIWELLEKTAPGAGGEIQLTDAIVHLLRMQTVEAFRIKGRSHDCGSKLGYVEANIAYALNHPELGRNVKKLLQGFVSEEKPKVVANK